MKKLLYDSRLFNLRELSEFCGVNYTTLCNRLRRGYSIEEAVAYDQRVPASVSRFLYESHPPDWDGMTNEAVYKIYFNWCIKNNYPIESKIHFIRTLKQCLPNMRVVTTRIKNNGGVSYKRIIRIDGWFER